MRGNPVRFLAVAATVAAAGCSEPEVAGPDTPGSLTAFAAADACGSCHPVQFEDWKASRHAYAGTDPVMHRMREIAGAEVGAVCMQCHAPAQRRLDLLRAAGIGTGGLDLHEDGLSCDACHSIAEVPPVATAAFLDEVDPGGPKYADLPDPVPTSAHASARREWYGTSAACAPCHQFDAANGTGLENSFREWESSALAGMGVECQDCHMPTYTGRAATAGPVREGLHRHTFVGPDYAYEAFRGIDLERQKEDIRDLLENSVSVSLPDFPASVARGASLDFRIAVRNDRTGHSIPSGVSFAREMWIEVVVRDGSGAVIRRSGWLEANGDLVAPGVDPDLVRFHSQLFDANGAPTPFAWEAVSIDESGLLPFLAVRAAGYSVPVGADVPGPLTVDMALRFRSLPPALVRRLGLERILPIEIFDMWRETRLVAVTP